MSATATACPRCPLALHPVGTQGQAHACPDGHGLLLSREELERALGAEHARALLSAAQGSPVPGAGCPACGATMREVRFWEADLLVEGCVLCGASWFDEGELPKVRDEGLAPMRHALPDLPLALRGVLRGLRGGPSFRG